MEEIRRLPDSNNYSRDDEIVEVPRIIDGEEDDEIQELPDCFMDGDGTDELPFRRIDAIKDARAGRIYEEFSFEHDEDEEESEEDKMNPFGKVIGYDTIKDEMLQICDMIQNPDVYKALGARLPQGLLLYGDPGLGKTLMARSFIKASGLKAYTLRKCKGDEDFLYEISEAFKTAARNAPSIIFLDDMDKFANEDCDHRDAEEYVAVQAGIDMVKGKQVFVLATANDIYKLPGSLIRSGRFDRRIEVRCPTEADAEKIVSYYLGTKKVSENINMEDIVHMISYSSCAELETMLNEAAISAAHARKDNLEMEDLVGAVLRMQYDAPDNYSKTSEDELRRTALHEAGHLVVSEVLCPCSVGLASIRATGRGGAGGFIHRCKEFTNPYHYVLVSLAGKVATELYYADSCAAGCQDDIRKAYSSIRDLISNSGDCGLGFVDISTRQFRGVSEPLLARNEAAVEAVLEQMMLKAKDILLKNRSFLEQVSNALFEKETLLYSDIRTLRENVTINGVAA